MHSLPASVDLHEHVQLIHTQGNISSCTACASILAIEIILARAGKHEFLSRLFVYYMTRKLAGRLDCHGASLKDTLSALQQYGVPPENLWPYRYRSENIMPSTAAIDAAIHRKLIDYETVPINIQNIKEQLANGKPVIIGFLAGQLFWKIKGPITEQIYKPLNRFDNTYLRGHASTIIGYDDNLNNGSFIIANSLGPTWGSNGYGIFPYECIVDAGEAYTINNFNGISAIKNFHEIDK